MKIVIIEDEMLVAANLEASIRQLVDEPVDIIKLESVEESINYFRSNNEPDLIFSDIQLGDGLSFEIFVTAPISAPVIFCTAYDQYALDAFKANGIEYILKPFTRQLLQGALQRYDQLKKVFSTNQARQYDALMQLLSIRPAQPATSVLAYHQDKIIPIKLENIALFYLENEVIHLLTFSGKVYYPNKSFDELERSCGSYFFRANRQFLVCKKSITDVSSFFSRKLSVNLNIPFGGKIIVSRTKASQFLEWLANG